MIFRDVRQVSYEEGAHYMAENKLDIFFETSAKNGDNIKKVFYEAAKKIIDRKNVLGAVNMQYKRNAAKSAINLPDIGQIDRREERREKCKC